MTRFAFRRIVTAFVLVAVLGVPLSSVAAPRAAAERVEDRPVATAPFFAWLWHFLASTWTKDGCSLDPYGLCKD